MLNWTESGHSSPFPTVAAAAGAGSGSELDGDGAGLALAEAATSEGVAPVGCAAARRSR